MDIDKLSIGERIAAVSALLLFIFMFFDWFSVEVSGSSGPFTASASEGGNAWDALDNIPIFLVITVVVTVGFAAVRLADTDFEPAISLNAVVAVLGAISVLLILFRIIDPPDVVSVPGLSIDVSPAFGIFLGLIAAGGITYGGFRGMQEEGTSFSETADRLSSRGGGGTGSGTEPPSTPPPPPPPPPSSDPPPPQSADPPPPPSSSGTQ